MIYWLHVSIKKSDNKIEKAQKVSPTHKLSSMQDTPN